MRNALCQSNMSSVASARTMRTACSAMFFAVRFFAYCFFYYFNYYFQAIQSRKGICAF